MHCLSFLYLFAYRDTWDVEGITKMSEFEFKFHVRHCSLVLFRMIKCQADVSPVLFQRDESGFGAWKTRDVPHKCKNLDKLRNWQSEHRTCATNCVRGGEFNS